MIDSESSRHAVGLDDRIERDGKSVKQGKELQILEPIKYRKTYLASLVSSSFISPDAVIRKKHLEAYFDVRLDPPLLQILDYEAAETRKIKGSIRNFSRTVKRIVLHPPKSSRFSLSVPFHKINDEILISPGMSLELIVHFLLSESDESNRLYTDRVMIDIIGQPSIVLPIEAFPNSPNVKFVSKLDFGFQLYFENGDWVSKEFLVENLGKSCGTFSWIVKSKYLKITPSSFILDSADNSNSSSCKITVEFIPAKIGNFSETIYLETQNQISTPKNRSAAPRKERKPLKITANVFEHKLALVNRDGTSVNTQKMDFGTVYCNQNGTMQFKLENNSPECLKWIICHEVDHVHTLTNNHTLDEEHKYNTFIVAIPSEGVLEPLKSCKVRFEFCPKSKKPEKGWQTNRAIEPVTSYSVPMLLKIINSTAEITQTPGQMPIPLLFTAKSCPLMYNLSAKKIDFGEVDVGSSSFKDFTIKNCSELLGFGFRFENAAQFEFNPRIGSLPLNSSLNIRVSFSPNQFGKFEKIVQCHIFDLKQLKKSLGKQRLKKIGGSKLEQRIISKETVDLPSIFVSNINVSGTCTNKFLATSYLDIHNLHKPKPVDSRIRPLEMPKMDFKKVSEKINPEWEEKISRQKKHIQMLRNNRVARLDAQKNRYFGSDGILFVSASNDYRNIDRENGLLVPEYIDQSSHLVNHSKTVSEQESESSLNRKIKELLLKLQEPIAFNLEAKQSSATLIDSHISSEDLQKIFVSSTDIDIVDVSVHSVNIAPLNFLNTINSREPIHISLNIITENPDVLSLSSNFLILPSMSIAGVNLKLLSHESGLYKFTIAYTVNQRYKYFVNVTANVLGLNLILDTKKIELLADFVTVDSLLLDKDDRIFSPMTPRINTQTNFSLPMAVHKIVLKNDGNYPCGFSCNVETHNMNKNLKSEIISMDGFLLVEPSMCEVPPRQSRAVTLTYFAGVKSKLEADIVFKIEDTFGGATQLLETVNIPFEGSINSPQCSVIGTKAKGTPIEFGILVSNIDSKYDSLLYKVATKVRTKNQLIGCHTVKLKNISPHHAMFTASILSENTDISLSPSFGIINGNGNIFELDLKISPKKNGTFNEILAIHIAGGEKVIKIPLKYEASEPKTTMEFTNLHDSNEVIVDCSSSHKIVLRNDGITINRYIIDLRLWNALKLLPLNQIKYEAQKELDIQKEIVDISPIIEISQDNILYGYDSNRSMEALNLYGSLYIVDVLPNQVTEMILKYSPNVPELINLSIPVVLIGRNQNITLPLELKSVPSPISVLTKVVDFHIKVVFEHANGSAKKEVLEFKNNTNLELTWKINVGPKTTLFKNGIYKIDQSEGTVGPYKTENVAIFFNPEKSEKYGAEINLLVDYLDTIAEFPIKISGTGVYPSILFDPPEIFLPVLATGSDSLAFFSIINYGCERKELTSILELELEKHNLFLEIEYLESKILKGDGEKLRAAFRFGSRNALEPSTPCSFSTKVEFINSANNSFFVTVHGTSDNSLFSLQSCIWKNSKDSYFKFDECQKSLNFLKKDNLVLKPKMDRFRDHQTFFTVTGLKITDSLDEKNAFSFFNKTASILWNWMDESLRSQLGPVFPDNVIETRGKAVADIIYLFSGRKIPGLTSISISVPLSEKFKETLKQYGLILNNLKNNGALISSVKPEFLLSEKDFNNFVQDKINQIQSEYSVTIADQFSLWYKNFQKKFKLISIEAWTTLFLQIYKIYTINTVTLKHFKLNEGAQITPSWGFKTSNVFSVSEMILLKWSSFIVSTQMKEDIYITSFQELFKQPKYIVLLVSHYISDRSKQLIKLLKSLDSIEWASAVICLKEIFGNQTFFTKIDDIDWEAINMPLLALFLYQTLPQFKNQLEIEFKTSILDSVEKSVFLSNSNHHMMKYNCNMEGSSDFSVQDIKFEIPSKSSSYLKILFKSRFVKRSEAKLQLISSQLGLNHSSIILISLYSTINEIFPAKTFKIASEIYSNPVHSMQLSITNIFDQPGSFKINMRQFKKDIQHCASVRNFPILMFKERIHESYNPAPFKILDSVIDIEAGGSKMLKIFYIAFELFETGCYLHFYDEKVGEFLYKVEGVPKMPIQTETLNWVCKSETVLEKSIKIFHNNPVRDRAIHSLLLLGNTSKTVDIHTGVYLTKNSSFYNSEKDAYILPKRSLEYSVNYSNDAFSGPSEVVINPFTEKTLKNVFESCGTHLDLPIKFSPKLAGRYACQITLKSKDTTDIRIYNLNCSVRMEGRKADFEFSAPARQEVVQEIPIINNSDNEWTIRAHFNNDVGFFGPFSILAPGKKISYYPVSFIPHKAGDYQSNLSLKNMTDSQNNLYSLKGVASDPYPESEITIEGAARSPINYEVAVKNITEKDINYEVQTDIPNFTGPRSIKSQKNSSSIFKFMVIPKFSGSLQGILKFINRHDQSYLYYIINLQIKRPPPESQIILKTVAGKRVEFKVPLKNPTDSPIKMKATLEGNDLVLKNEAEFLLGPLEELEYSVLYYPRLPSSSKGAIYFTSENIGEFGYELILESDKTPPVLLPSFSCPIGKSSIYNLEVKNYGLNPAILQAHLEATKDFFLYDKCSHGTSEKMQSLSFELLPNEYRYIDISFCPSSLAKSSKSLLNVESEVNGTYIYILEGIGTKPETMDEIVVSSPVNNTQSHVLKFSNPFLEPITIFIELIQEDNQFNLMLSKRKTFTIGVGDSIDIPFTFSPKELKSTTAKLLLHMNEEMKWIYPIRGIVDTVLPIKPIFLEVKARDRIVKNIEIELKGQNFDDETLSSLKDRLEITFESLINVDLKDVSINEYRVLSGGKVLIQLNILFSSKKPIDVTGSICITDQKAFCRWKIPVHLVVTLPAYKETIILDSNQGTNSFESSFVVKSRSSKEENFTAYFLKDDQFVVKPSSGLLKPDSLMNNTDNIFNVGFRTPKYSKNCSSILVIETMDYCWFYEIKFTRPHNCVSKITRKNLLNLPQLKDKHHQSVGATTFDKKSVK